MEHPHQQRSVAGRLLRSAQLLERSLEDTLRTIGLTPGDFDVLDALRRLADPAGVNPRELAASALITSGAMTSRLDRLERAGFVRRAPDPADRRAIRVHLTDEGERVAGRALAAVLDADERFLEPLGSREARALAGGLSSLLRHNDT